MLAKKILSFGFLTMGNYFSSTSRAGSEMALKLVNEAIAKDKVVIFSKTYCPYCTMAKEVILFTLLHIIALAQIIGNIFPFLC